MFRLSRFHSPEFMLVLALLLLNGVGLTVLFSIEMAQNVSGFNPYYQLGFVTLGFSLMLSLRLLPESFIYKSAWWLYFLSLLSLALLFVFGEPIRGVLRWYDFGMIQFQPSELMKAGLVLLMARVLANRRKVKSSHLLLVTALYVIPPVVLILLQPDLGTAGALILIWMIMLSISQLPKRWMIGLGIAGIALMAVSIPFMADYQKERIATFIDPMSDPAGAGYNLRQSMIAIGSGGLLGQGLAGGTQSQLHFLPSQHTDFIFAATAEKLGLIGVLFEILLFVIIVWIILGISKRSHNLYSAYVVAGVGFLIAAQALINIAMNVGLLPITGIPLPFLTYGGTHTLVNFMLLGIVLSIARRSKKLNFAI